MRVSEVRPLPIVLVAFLCNGCDRSGGVIPVFPVSGKVFVGDVPAAQAHIAFHPLDAHDPRVVEPDGTFRLSTRRAYDGIPAGEYAVTVVWPSTSKKQDGKNAGPDLLEGRYARVESTPLHAHIVEKPNELEPFQLK